MRKAIIGVEHTMYPDSSTVSMDSGDIDYCADHAAQEMATDE
jgi:hypothetical protein